MPLAREGGRWGVQRGVSGGPVRGPPDAPLPLAERAARSLNKQRKKDLAYLFHKITRCGFEDTSSISGFILLSNSLLTRYRLAISHTLSPA